MNRRLPALLLPVLALAGIAAGLTLRLAGAPTAAHHLWLAGLLVTSLPLVWNTIAGLFRARFAADIVATLAILTAVLLQQPLAGLLVVLMQSGGEALERYAEGRASRAVRELEARAPRQAHRLVGEQVDDVPAEAVRPGDRLLVRPGELVACNCVVVSGRSHVDASALTGEPIPITADAGTTLLSGSLNLEGSLTVRATATAGESEYARIVQLVRAAQSSKAPVQRLADRYAAWFTPLTLLVCLVAYLASRDPMRVLAVLVVATPCPLILATPVAVIGGINRAARRGILFRTGAALEHLGEVTAAVFDKTGTLTVGRPQVAKVVAQQPEDRREMLRLASAVERESGHLLARSLVDAAEREGVAARGATSVVEAPGSGISGEVDGREVAVGSRGWLARKYPNQSEALFSANGHRPGLRAYIAIDRRFAGMVEFADQLRSGAARTVSGLRQRGVRQVLLLSGDAQRNADEVARAAGIGEVHGDLLPADKVAVIERLRRDGHDVLMVGDGTNDAPALSAATVGVALTAHGGGVTAQAADIVLLTDDPGLVVDALDISRRSLRIARQSIGVGLGLSGLAMVAAALGHIPPIAGALLQEVIDVAVILNALRASAETAAL